MTEGIRFDTMQTRKGNSAGSSSAAVVLQQLVVARHKFSVNPSVKPHCRTNVQISPESTFAPSVSIQKAEVKLPAH